MFSQNVPLDTQMSVLTRLPKLFRQMFIMFSLKVRKWWKYFFFSKKFLSKEKFLPKKFPLTRCSLTILQKSFRQKLVKVFIPSAKVMKRNAGFSKKVPNIPLEMLNAVSISLLVFFRKSDCVLLKVWKR